MNGMRFAMALAVLALVAACSDPEPPAATVLDQPTTTDRAARLQSIDDQLVADSPLRFAPEGQPPDIDIDIDDVAVSSPAPGSIEALRRAARDRDAGASATGTGGVAGDDFMPRYRDGQLLRPDLEPRAAARQPPLDAEIATR